MSEEEQKRAPKAVYEGGRGERIETMSLSGHRGITGHSNVISI
jgi:hypothetical protein